MNWYSIMNSLDDTDCWIKYPNHRLIFNKLYMSLKLGYDCGPACVPVTQSGNYVIRPIVNLYGMGLGASICYIDVDEKQYMIDHGIIPPGYFWCEYFDGNHYSVDYVRENNKWKQIHAMVGINSKNSLTKFTKWTIINEVDISLPSFINDISDVEYLNIEAKSDKIIEIHLRTGNDVLHNSPVGTTLIPLWEGEEDKINDSFIPNDLPEKKYNASGYLKDIRIGYISET